MSFTIVPKKPVPPASLERLAVSAKEAAAMLGITERTLRNWAKRGEIRPRRIGGRTLYSMDSLRSMLDGPAVQSAQEN